MEVKHFEYNNGVVSLEQYEQHLKLYKGYIDKVNQITGELKRSSEEKGANATYSGYRALKRGETYALDGVILHESYFENMCKEKSAPLEKTADIINKNFGSYEAWKSDFTACCKAARGWCIFSYEQRSNSCRNILLDSHYDGVVCMAYPLITMDMYEHAWATCSAIEKIVA